ncbi:hypothetical protein NQ317_001161 [Molorchus minor]|uniref:Uncharacterized protein n=1 Tax=Molorchus minor TaxID=1323400 RepID=A0ABQ9JWU7_9CUCU|nr:hypothetical protein NQ317_001161 [Molorchus minor]
MFDFFNTKFILLLLITGYALAANRSFSPGFLVWGIFCSLPSRGWLECRWWVKLCNKGISIWDKLLHDDPSFSYQNANGDVAADTYTHGPADVVYFQAMGLTHYRFSIAWTRILPTGKADYISEAGVAYYNRLIDALVAANIKPLVTLYHWDLPNDLQDLGGFLNAEIQEWFADYARVCFEKFGDRVKHWLTFNEPISTCVGGYEDGSRAPVIKNKGTGGYECAHNVLLAHGKAFRLYESEFKSSQNGNKIACQQRGTCILVTSRAERQYYASQGHASYRIRLSLSVA